MLKFGIVTERDATLCKCRVRFTENNIVSGWLHVVVATSKDNKHYYLPDIDEQVVCMMDDNLETGVILGAVYSKVDRVPAEANENTEMVEFSDGTIIKYDRSERRLDVTMDGGVLRILCNEANIECTTATITTTDGCFITGDTEIDGSLTVTGNGEVQGSVSVSGSIDATGDVTAGPLNISLLTHKHISAPSGNPTGPSIP